MNQILLSKYRGSSNIILLQSIYYHARLRHLFWRISQLAIISIAVLVSFNDSFGQAAQPEILTNATIITMKKMHLSNSIVKNKINTTQCNFNTDVQSLSDLKSAGVDDDVIEAMMTKGNRALVASPSVQPGTGTLSEDKKTYVSSGNITFHVGDNIKINVGSNILTGSFKYITKDQGKVLNAINDAVPMTSDYAQQIFVIKEIYSARSSSNDMFIKNAPRTIYIVVEPTRGMRYRIAIEAALQEKEVLVN